MRRRATLVVLLLAAKAGVAGATLADADIVDRGDIHDPATLEAAGYDGWMVFTIPAQAETRSPCCWRGDWDSRREAGCRLDTARDDRQINWGTRGDAGPTERLGLYVRFDAGRPDAMLAVGDRCPVDGAGQHVTRIGNVGEHTALTALARHRSEDATRHLDEIAGGPNAELAEEAVFWLAQGYPDTAVRELPLLLDGETDGDVREQIVFAVSQLPDGTGDELLFDWARDPQRDKAIRRQAFFWLAQSGDPATIERLAALLRR